jgi:hypothetical protein
VQANPTALGPELLNKVLTGAQAFTGKRDFVDDVCLAAVELLEDGFDLA